MVIDELYFKVEADIADARRDISALRQQMGRTEQKANGFVSSLKNIAGITGGVMIVQQLGRAVARFGRESIAAASAAEEIRSKFQVVFGSSAREVEAWAQEYSDSLNRNVTANLSFLSSIQDTLVPLGMARDEAAEFSTNLVELATDIGSFNDMPTARVLADIQSALVGNSETVRKYGIVLNQAQLEQIAINEGLIEQGEELDPLSKAMAAYTGIVEGSADAQGDAERTMDSWANQSRQLSDSFVTLKEETGKLLQEGFRPLKRLLTELISGFSSMLGQLNDMRDATDALREANETMSDEDIVKAYEEQEAALQRITSEMEALSEPTLWTRLQQVLGFGQNRLNNLAAQGMALERNLQGMEDEYEQAKSNLDIQQQLTEEAEAQAEAAEAEAEAAREAWAAEQKRLEELQEARTELGSERAASTWAAGILEDMGVIGAEEKMRQEMRALENEINSLVALGYNAMRGGTVYDKLEDYLNAEGFTDYGGETFETEAGDEQLLRAIEALRELRDEYNRLYGDIEEGEDAADDVGEELSFWEEHLQRATDAVQEQAAATEALSRLEDEMAEAMAAGDEERIEALTIMEETLERILGIEEERSEEVQYQNAGLTSQKQVVAEMEAQWREQARTIDLVRSAVKDIYNTIGGDQYDVSEGVADAVATAGSVAGPQVAAVVKVFRDVFQVFIDWARATDTTEVVEESREAVAGIFDDILGEEETLRQTRLDAIDEELEEAQEAHDEKMALLNQAFSTEQRILQQRFERGLIGQEEFRTQAGQISEEHLGEVAEAEGEIQTARDEGEAARRFESTKQALISQLQSQKEQLIATFEDMYVGLGLSSFDSYQPNTPYPLIPGTWGSGDENLYNQINSLTGLISDVQGADSMEAIAGLNVPSFATGGHFRTTGEQLIRVGEAGPEEVNIRPVNNRRGSGGGSLTIENVTINNPMSLDDVAISIENIQRRLADRGVGVRDV